jgi:6-phosphogluconolactonase (cycloisomerase 2 family)
MLKKAAALFLVCASLAICVSCGKTVSHYVYAAIPTASQIVVYREDPNSGILNVLAGSPFSAGPGVQSIVIHPSKQFLYAANSSEGDISLFDIESGGALTEVTPRTPSGGITPTLLVMDPAGSFLYVGNTESENIAVFSIDSSSGKLTAVPGSPVGLSISPLNMKLAPNGSVLYITGAGSPGYIEAWSVVSGVPTSLLNPVVQPGSSPYGLAINPSGSYLYTANFGDNSISEFSINSDGSLTELPGSPIGEAYTSPVSLLIDNSGKYLYVANEGSGNLGAYAIGSDGGLTLLTNSPFGTNAQPSFIAMDPTENYLFVGNQKGGAIESFSLDTSSGSLTEVGSYSVGSTPTSIAVLP